MNTDEFNRALARSRSSAENELPALVGVYQRAIEKLAVEAARTFTGLVAVAWHPPPEGMLSAAVTSAAAALATAQQRIHQRILRLVTEPPLERLGIAWDVSHPLSQQLLSRAGERTGERLGLAVQPVLRSILASAYEQGLSVPDTATLIRDGIRDAAPWQADMLARTDLNGLANGGSVIAARLAGAGYKTWEATLDDRTRPEHADAHGQTVPVDQPFQVGGEQLDYPGDPDGSDAMVANCRCTVTYGDNLSVTASGDRANMRGEMAGLTAAPFAQTRWISDLAFEGDATSDGRYMLPRSLTPRDLPLTLMAMTVTDDGHDGAFVAGRIDTVRRASMNIDGEPLPDGVMSMHGEGIFDMGGDNGAEIARLVSEQVLRGVSVDLGILEWCFRDPETGELIEPTDASDNELERAFFGELQFAIRKAEILAATVCPTPAFANARIALTSSADHARVIRVWAPLRIEQEPVAMIAAAAPARPPREWFETAEPPGKMPLTVTDDGRVYGHIATFDTCHTGIADVCTTPPRSPSGYAYFHVGELELEDGSKIPVGKLMLAAQGGRHAPLSASRAEAARHYDDTSCVAAYLRVSDGRHGIWACGAVNPDLPAPRVRELRTLPPSGDWREVDGRLELICALAVPVPGFPVPRAEAALIASGDDLHLSALVASSGRFDPAPLVERALAAAGLVPADDDARVRALVARAEDGIDGLVHLAEGATR